MNRARKQYAALCTTILSLLSVYSFTYADSLSGGTYTIDGGPTAISGATSQSGGTYSASTTATPAGGYVSGGTFTGGGTSPVIGFTSPTATSSSGASGSGGVFIASPVIIESVVTTSENTGATVTVRFNIPVSAHITYMAGDTTHVSEESPSALIHTFSLRNLSENTTYPFSFAVRNNAVATVLGPTVSFGGFELQTGNGARVPAHTIRGYVTDDVGTPINGAVVTARSLTAHSDTTAITATTNSDGTDATYTISLNGAVVTTGESVAFDTSIAGVHTIVYTITGTSISATRTVEVVAPTPTPAQQALEVAPTPEPEPTPTPEPDADPVQE